MNNRSKFNPPEMTSACKILQEMLKHSATKRRHTVGGNVGVSSQGHIVYNFADSFETYDADTNDLIRAKFACDQNMVVSPLSRSRMFYTTPENFKSELEEAERRAKEEEIQAQKGWFARVTRGPSK